MRETVHRILGRRALLAALVLVLLALTLIRFWEAPVSPALSITPAPAGGRFDSMPLAAPARFSTPLKQVHGKVLPTYYVYDPSAVEGLRAQTSVGQITLAELREWDSIMVQLVSTSYKLAPTLASKIYAYVLSAQGDAVSLSFAARGEPAGSITPVTAKILCSFFPDDCSRLGDGRRTDAYSQVLADLVFAHVQARMKAEKTPRKPYPIKVGDEFWAGLLPLTPDAGSWEPWLITSGSQFRAAPPPERGSAEDLLEIEKVRTATANRTQAQQRTILFWGGGPGTETPAGIWLRIANEYFQSEKVPLETVVLARSVLALTMADAFIACWDTKYTYWSQRPFMRNAGLHSSIPTPNFPSYTSGHATVAAAAATVLSHYFPRNADAWWAMATEARDSRLWSGIHFSVDNERGFQMGKQVADYVLRDPSHSPVEISR